MPDIVIDVAGEAGGVAGVAQEFVYSKVSPTPPLVTMSIDDNTGITMWAWEILDQPPGASATLGTPTASITTFTPTADIPGTYLIRATLNDGTYVPTNGVAWQTLQDKRHPAAGETVEFDADRGWAPAVEGFHEPPDFKRVTDYVASDTLTASDFEGVHRVEHASNAIDLTLPAIVASMIGKTAKIVKWGDGNAAFVANGSNYIGDGAAGGRLQNTVGAAETKIAWASVTVISLTEYSIDFGVGGWQTT